jgi:hypothetical protein
MLIPKIVNTPIGFIVFCVGILLVVAGIRWVGNPLAPQPIPLFLQTPHLLTFADLQAAQTYLHQTVVVPSKTFEADIRAVGVYPEDEYGMAAGSIFVVYEKDGWRVAEWSLQPGLSMENEILREKNAVRETIDVEGREAALLRIQRLITDCRPASEKQNVGMCQITRKIIFEKDGVLYTLAADGSGLTDGELIEMVRSVVFP